MCLVSRLVGDRVVADPEDVFHPQAPFGQACAEGGRVGGGCGGLAENGRCAEGEQQQGQDLEVHVGNPLAMGRGMHKIN
ncbi:hypothetical protein D3C86_1932450 [compost metagenome]